MSQGANQATEANQPGVPVPERPTADESLGYGDAGL
jgi:hypothetical protein